MPGNGSRNGRREPKIDPLKEMRANALRAEQERQQAVEMESDDLVEIYRSNGYSFEESMANLEMQRRMALKMGDIGAANTAEYSKAKLAGLMIDRQAVLHANSTNGLDFTGDAEEGTRLGIERLRARAGDLGISTRVVERLLAVLREEGVIRGGDPVPALPPR